MMTQIFITLPSGGGDGDDGNDDDDDDSDPHHTLWCPGNF